MSYFERTCKHLGEIILLAYLESSFVNPIGSLPIEIFTEWPQSSEIQIKYSLKGYTIKVWWWSKYAHPASPKEGTYNWTEYTGTPTWGICQQIEGRLGKKMVIWSPTKLAISLPFFFSFSTSWPKLNVPETWSKFQGIQTVKALGEPQIPTWGEGKVLTQILCLTKLYSQTFS